MILNVSCDDSADCHGDASNAAYVCNAAYGTSYGGGVDGANPSATCDACGATLYAVCVSCDACEYDASPKRNADVYEPQHDGFSAMLHATPGAHDPTAGFRAELYDRFSVFEQSDADKHCSFCGGGVGVLSVPCDHA
jgi:hypothetical protein